MFNQVTPTRLLVGTIATSFGVGFIPIIPATWASAAAGTLAWFAGGLSIYWVVGLSLAGLWACKGSQDLFRSADPKQFVMDETCGMLLSLIGLPVDLRYYVGAFILFRVLDIVKPWPISRIQQSKHAMSIMWDDLAAGLATNLILRIVIHFVHP